MEKKFMKKGQVSKLLTIFGCSLFSLSVYSTIAPLTEKQISSLCSGKEKPYFCPHHELPVNKGPVVANSNLADIAEAVAPIKKEENQEINQKDESLLKEQKLSDAHHLQAMDESNYEANEEGSDFTTGEIEGDTEEVPRRILDDGEQNQQTQPAYTSQIIDHGGAYYPCHREMTQYTYANHRCRVQDRKHDLQYRKPAFPKMRGGFNFGSSPYYTSASTSNYTPFYSSNNYINQFDGSNRYDYSKYNYLNNKYYQQFYRPSYQQRVIAQ